MDNRVDFFQSEKRELARSSGTAVVFVDDRLCGVLKPVEIVRGGRPGFGQARLEYNPVGCETGEMVSAEEIERIAPMGASMRIECVYGEGLRGYPVFAGRVEGIETRLGDEDETVEILARDFSAELERVTVYGQRVSRDGQTELLPSLDTIFNPGGLGNASDEVVQSNGQSYRVFAEQEGAGRLWSCAEAMDYLLCEYLVVGRVARPSLARLRALTEDAVVRDLDVTGCNLAEALQRCCEEAGIQFRFDARDCETGPGEAIVFYRAGCGREVELNRQPKGQRLSVSKTNVAGLRGLRERWPVTHRHIVQGGFKRYEATFDLVGCWDSADESATYEQFSPTTNPEFYKVRNVYRRWCLNEAGDYTGEPCEAGPAFDFSRIFEGQAYARSRRRFRPCLSRDKLGRSLGYYLEVSLDGGQNWSQYTHGFNLLLDECGIWLSSDQLDTDTWTAAQGGTLKFRMTASVDSDTRITAVSADGPVGGMVPVVDRVVTFTRRFGYRKVSPYSLFANVSDGSLGVADEIDDGDAITAFARARAEAAAAVIERFDVRTLSLETDYRPGDRVVSSPESRDVFGVRHDNRSVCCVESVRMDFVKQQTELGVVRRRVR